MRWLLAIAVSGCAAHSAAVTDATAHPPQPAGAATAAGAPAATGAISGDLAVVLPGGANALWWDAASSTLYLTDSNASALLVWTDADGLRPVATLPADAAGVSLGGLVRRGDGSWLIASFGFGTQGGMFSVTAAGAATALTGLDPTRRRVGLAQDPAGALYSSYFVGGRGKPAAGGVATVTIEGGAATETEIASGFHKVVGVVATPAAVYVSDQTDRAIYRIAVPGFAVSKLAALPAVDLLAILPDGDLVTGGGPTISRISPAGRVTTLPGAGFEQVRGLAYDPAGKRLFFIDHSVTVGVHDKLRALHLDAHAP